MILAVLLICLAPECCHLLVVAGHGYKGLVRHALAYILTVDETYDGVATFDVVVEELSGWPGL